MAANTDIALRIPSAAKVAGLTEIMTEDDFRFPRIKIQRDKPKYELPAPTNDDPDNIVVQAGFTAVVLLARQNFYQSEEDKEEGKEAREKRELYLIRADKVQPELVYVNPTSLNNWKKLTKDIRDAGEAYYYCLVNFGAEQAISKAKGYKWNKLTFELVRSLTDAERSHVDTLRELVEGRVKQYVNQDDLDNAESEVLGIKRPAAIAATGGLTAARNSAPPVAEEAPVRKPSVDDDEDDGAFSEKAQTTPQKPAAAPKPAPARRTKAAPAAEEEDAPAPAAKKEARSGYPSLDGDDDDAAPAPKASPKATAIAGSLDDDDE